MMKPHISYRSLGWAGAVLGVMLLALSSILILSINLGVDILYAYVDPRIRLA